MILRILKIDKIPLVSGVVSIEWSLFSGDRQISRGKTAESTIHNYSAFWTQTFDLNISFKEKNSRLFFRVYYNEDLIGNCEVKLDAQCLGKTITVLLENSKINSYLSVAVGEKTMSSDNSSAASLQGSGMGQNASDYSVSEPYSTSTLSQGIF